MYGALWDDCIAAMLSAQPLHGFQEEHFPVCGVNAHAQQAALAHSHSTSLASMLNLYFFCSMCIGQCQLVSVT